jgi:hypothetical protein
MAATMATPMLPMRTPADLVSCVFMTVERVQAPKVRPPRKSEGRPALQTNPCIASPLEPSPACATVFTHLAR